MKPNKPEPTEKMLGSNKTKLSFQPTRIVSNPGEYILQTGVSQLRRQGESAAFTDVTLVKKDGRPRLRHNITAPVHEHQLGAFVLGGSSVRIFRTTNKHKLDNMKALHMHGEVILCSDDVSTVGAVTKVGLS